jgi:tetratricopeptide (TPR) repeat protein
MAGDEDFESALEILESVSIRDEKRDVDNTIVSLYITLLRSGTDMEEADIDRYLGIIEQLIDKNPNYPDLFNSLGILYVAKSKILMDRAGESFNRALEINREYEKAKRNIRLSDNERQGIFILLKALLD